MREIYYFQHDYNPTNDPKVICLLGNHGGLGYGVFWRIIEMLHQEETHKLPKKLYIYEAIAKQMLASAKQVEAIVNDCITKYELLMGDDNLFWSSRVNINIENRRKISEIRSIAGNKGVVAKQLLSKAKQSLAKERKGKEIKGNRIISIVDKSADPITEHINEIIKIFYDMVNPNINYGNKTLRTAAEWLINKYGFDRVSKIAVYACSVQGQKYAPTITTPYQLKEKMAELKIYKDKEKPNITIIE